MGEAMIQFFPLVPSQVIDLGFIPAMLSEENPKLAKEQLDDGYQHGGGWSPFVGFRLEDDNSLHYPGDPPMFPLAYAMLRDELILFYPFAWVAIVQKDRSFEICQMD